MLRLLGKSVYKGIAVGNVVVLEKKDQVVTRRRTEDIEDEIRRFSFAVEQTKEQLEKLPASDTDRELSVGNFKDVLEKMKEHLPKK